MRINAIVLGATGMVGEGVLHESLNHSDVASVLVLGRRPSGVIHEKLKELVATDLYDITPFEKQLTGYNACYFCLGTTSVGKKEDEYRRVTYDLTMHVATTLVRLNPDMTFCYVSGLGTDSSERGKTMWARVKGKTENDLMKLRFKASYMFRPGFIKPIPGLKNAISFAKVLSPLYPLFKSLTPSYVCALEDIGRAMIDVSLRGYPKQILECADIEKSSQS